MFVSKKIYYFIPILVAINLLKALTWPVANTDPNHPQPQVAVTYGDWTDQETPPFHAAVDIPTKGGQTNGTAVKAVTTGTITHIFLYSSNFPWYGLYLKEDGTEKIWVYCHLEEPFYSVGTHVEEGQEIARIWHNWTIYPWPAGMDDHLHLVYCGTTGDRYHPADNPLLYLPYSDPGNALPFVWFPEIFIYNRAAVKNIYGKFWWLYPPYAGEPTPIIYDYVDILAKAQDDMNGTLANGNKVYTGVFEPGFWITDKNDNSVLGPLFLHQFSGPLPSGDKFDAYFSEENPSSNWHDFYYIVTNVEGEATRCWATKARTGGTSENDPKARINSEALFPDKEYKIWLFNRDAGNHLSQDKAYVCLDNFRPYVKMVQIGQEEKVVKYQAHWPTTPQNDYDLGQLIIDKDDDCKVGKLLTFLIEFSEDMKTDVLPTLQVQFPSRCSTTFNLSIDIRNNLDNILWLINNKEV